MAQSGSAPALGAGGPGFESRRPDVPRRIRPSWVCSIDNPDFPLSPVTLVLVLVRNGEAHLVEDVSNPGDDQLSRMIGAPELRRLEFGVDSGGGSEIVAFASEDPRGYAPNCRIDGLRYPVYGPVVVLGSEDGRHRGLREDELLAIELIPPRGEDRLPRLRIKSDLMVPRLHEGGTAA